MSSPIVALAIGCILSAVIAYLLAARFYGKKADTFHLQQRVLEERLNGLNQQITDRDVAVKSLEDQKVALQNELRGAIDESLTLRERLANQEAAFEQTKTAMKDVFAQTASDALTQNGKNFLQLAETELNKHKEAATGELNTKKAEIEGLVNPINTTLTALDEKVRSLTQSEKDLLHETRQLATALKDPKRRGEWGQLQLQRIAELAGMQERCDFILQDSILTDENRRLIPDMTARLPNNRVVVVDSKASMVAYGEAANASDPEIQKQKLIEHAKAVKKRVEELAAKEYQSHVDGSADFVVCFIPGEGFFSAAIAADPDLLEYAAERSVILASPTTLLTLLRAVALGWKEAKLAENAKSICELGLELYDRLRTSATHIEGIGDSLESAVEAYDSFLGSMERRVFPQARRFRSLVASDKELPNAEPVEMKVRRRTAVDWIPERSLVLPDLAAEESE